MVAVGDELARRGHEIVVVVNADLAGWYARAGLEVLATDLDVGRFLGSEQARRFLATGRVRETVRRIAADECAVNDSITRACLQACVGADLILCTLMICPVRRGDHPLRLDHRRRRHR